MQEDDDDNHPPALLLHDLPSFLAFVSSHPLHCVCLLFFSPYILHLLSFLTPLLSTSLLLLLTVHPEAADPFPGRTSRFVVHSLKAELGGGGAAAPSCLLEQICDMVLAPIDDEFIRQPLHDPSPEAATDNAEEESVETRSRAASERLKEREGVEENSGLHALRRESNLPALQGEEGGGRPGQDGLAVGGLRGGFKEAEQVLQQEQRKGKP